MVLPDLLFLEGRIGPVSLAEKIVEQLEQHKLVARKLFVLLLVLDVHLAKRVHPFVDHEPGEDKVFQIVLNSFESLHGH